MEPVAFQAVHQPPQDQHPFGPDRIGQPVQVLGGQVVDRRGEGCQPSAGLTECVFGSMAATYQPPPDHKHQPQIWGQPFPRESRQTSVNG